MTVDAVMDNLTSILEAIGSAQDGKSSSQTIIPFNPCSDPSQLETVLLLKPEVTGLMHGVNVGRVLGFVTSTLERWNLSVAALSVLGADYLREYDIISKHYGVINRISNEGSSALSVEAKRRLQEHFHEEIYKGYTILGGHQFQVMYPEITPRFLDLLVINLGVTKLAPGAYCTKIKIDGVTFLLLNGFHPYLIERYTAPGRVIIVLDIRGQGDWKSLRNNLLGATDPVVASPGSLRREFLEHKSEFRIGQIDQRSNAIHLSAGPLEGMVETIGFFSDYATGHLLDPSYTCFGSLLLEAGYDGATTEWLTTNPDLYIGERRISAFDLTEETQPTEAVRLLQEGKKQLQI